jgi:hypothetical protein
MSHSQLMRGFLEQVGPTGLDSIIVLSVSDKLD